MVKLGLVLAGLCHDLGHTSHTNLFEINSYSKKAQIYNDISVLENYHASKMFKILSKENCNILENLALDQFNQLRSMIISNILATDMKRHFEIIGKAEVIVTEKNEIKEFTLKQTDIECITGLFMHGCDFFGAVKPFQISQLWSQKVNTEFQNQEQLERQLNIPQTPNFKNLDDPLIKAKNEIGFLSMFVQPIWIIINDFFDKDYDFILEQLQETLQKWQEIKEKIK